MKVDVLKADHHGSCNGVSDAYLDLLDPSLVVVSLAGVNDYGHMHTQAKTMFRHHHIPWYRTDRNGTITLQSSGVPGEKYTVQVERKGKSLSGPGDKRSKDPVCTAH
jgi:competence protein ComEC